MKIGIDVNSLTRSLTGVGTYVYESIKYISELDKTNTYYLYTNDELICKLIEQENFIIRMSRCSNVVLWYMYTLPAEIENDNINLFWEPGNRLPVIPRDDIKIVATIHDMASYLFPSYCSWKTAIMERLFLKKTCDKADRLISISESTKKDIIQTYGIDEGKIKVIYNGDTPYKVDREYDIHFLNRMKEKYGIIGNYYLFIGTINPRKNCEIIIKAYNNYRDQGGINTLVLAGKLAAGSKKIKNLIKASKYKDDIIITGYISEVEKEYFYKFASCLLFPSRYEGFGFPIVEAMSLGTLVITSNVSSMPEVAGEAALYLNNIDDDKELSGLLFRVDKMTEKEKKQRIKLGISNVKRFSRLIATKELLKVFNEVLGKVDKDNE